MSESWTLRYLSRRPSGSGACSAVVATPSSPMMVVLGVVSSSGRFSFRARERVRGPGSLSELSLWSSSSELNLKRNLRFRGCSLLSPSACVASRQGELERAEAGEEECTERCVPKGLGLGEWLFVR